MAKSPAVLFYTSDFLVGVDDMDMAQRGAYITLLCKQHQTGHLSEAAMFRICGGYDEMIFSKFVIDANGYYYNERMDVEIDTRNRHCEKQRENVNKRWNKDKKDTTVLPRYQNGIDLVLPLENENDNECVNAFDVAFDVKSVDVGVDVVSEGICNSDSSGEAAPGVKSPLNKAQQERFDRFWAAYPVKKGKGGARRSWKVINPDDALLERMLTAIDTARKHDRAWREGYIPFPQTWLNQARWEDVIDARQERLPSQGPRYGPQEVDKGQIYENAMAVLEELKLEREAQNGAA